MIENYQEIKKRKEELKLLAEHNAQEAAKRKLSQDVERHVRTIFIGALADIEEEIGWLWGHGKSIDELNENELEEREHWEKLRNNILNRGNSRLRTIIEEIDKYVISTQKSGATFKF